MIGYRTILAGLIAFAVAVAPVAAALVAGVGARAATAATVHDCHGKADQDAHTASSTDAAQHGHQMAVQDADEGGCPNCDSQGKVKCIGDGGKCCKLTGMVVALPIVIAPLEAVDLQVQPPALIGWLARPPSPPPRA